MSKLDASGNFVWAKSWGWGGGDDRANDVSVDSNGNVYTTGYFSGTADFDPGAGITTLTSAAYYDIFVSKLDASGNFVWAKGLGGNYDDIANGISVDSSGNVYTTGHFNGTADFDPGLGVTNLTSVSASLDIFVSKLDTSGNFVWVKALGGSNSDIARDISVDSNGNVYTTGYFNGTADFDPGAGITNLTSAGFSAIFVSKLDASGNFVWAKGLGGSYGDIANGISVDSSGNVYTTGAFSDAADFDPGAGTFNLVSAGFSDIFVSKLDTNGNFVWARGLGGSNDDFVTGISVDVNGNVYTTGSFYGTADFDPSASTFNLTSTGGTATDTDLFVSKLDSSGNFVWAKGLGGLSNDYATGISLSNSGNVYTTGNFLGTVDFDPGTGTFNLTTGGTQNVFLFRLNAAGNFLRAQQFTAGSLGSNAKTVVDSVGNVYSVGFFTGTVDADLGAGAFTLTSEGDNDIFVSKLDSSGNFVWAKRLGGRGNDRHTGISVDGSGNVYITGTFYETADFDPGVGTFNLASAGGSDAFVSKLDTSGNFVWARRLGGSSDDVASSISVDSSGNVYTTGFFYNTADFDPGAGIFNLTSAGGADIYVSKLDVNGNFVWAKRLGGSPGGIALGISVDGSGNVYTTGYFSGTVDFDPGAGIFNLTSAGGADIYVSKLNASGNFVWAKQLGGSGGDQVSGMTIDSSGNVYTTGYFSGTADFDPGTSLFNLTSVGDDDSFVSKLDANGNFVWVKRLGGSSANLASGISIDSSGSVYTTSSFYGILDFDPSTGTTNLTSAGGNGILVSKLDVNGNFVWVKGIVGSSNVRATSISVDSSGNVYTTGSFVGTVDFDPGTGTFNLATGGTTNIFLSKLFQVPVVSLSNPSALPTEGNSGNTAYTFTVTLSAASTQTVSVNYTTADGTATVADKDYIAVSGVITFNPGETIKTITVNVKGDTKFEQHETFLFKLLNPTHATIALNADTGTGTIVNDDRVNLVWRNSVSGQNAVWQLNGLTVRSSYYLPTVADANWQIVSTADFNQDGIADILWRNQFTGATGIWQMNSTGYQTSYNITTVADANWQIVSTADFNKDGIPDLLWRNVKTGENGIWQMNGFTVQTTAYINPVADTNWQIVSTADFNRDGIADLLWRNVKTGENGIWQMNGFTVQSTSYINPVTDANWQLFGTTDFNGDGTSDLLWRHKATGENGIWQMNGFTVQTTAYINPVADTNWRVKPLVTA